MTRLTRLFTESDKKWLDFRRSIVCEFLVCLWNIPKKHVLCASVAARNFQDLLLSWNGEMGSVRMKWILSFEGPLPKDFYPEGDLLLIIDNQPINDDFSDEKILSLITFRKFFENFELPFWRVRDPVTSAERRNFSRHGCNGIESSMLYRVLCAQLSSPQLRGGGPLRPPRGRRRRLWGKGWIRSCRCQGFPYLGVSKNRETPPNHPFLIGFSIINHLFWGTPIFGNTYLCSRDQPPYQKLRQKFLRWTSKKWFAKKAFPRKNICQVDTLGTT